MVAVLQGLNVVATINAVLPTPFAVAWGLARPVAMSDRLVVPVIVVPMMGSVVPAGAARQISFVVQRGVVIRILRYVVEGIYVVLQRTVVVLVDVVLGTESQVK